MKWWWLLLILILLRAGAQADGAVEAPPRPPEQIAAMKSDTVQAATSKAVANLYEQIAPLPIAPSQTVGQYLKANNLEDDFRDALRRADQIGGPRWIDDYTCQIRLEIPVARVTYALKQFAAAHPRTSPAPDQIERIARTWPRQVIGSTGSSAASVKLRDLRPPEGAWRDVDEQLRERTLEEARLNAVEAAMKSVERVSLGPGQTLGDAFANPEIARTVGDWLASRPVSEVDFGAAPRSAGRQKLTVTVTLGVDRDDYFDQVRAALAVDKTLQSPGSEEAWESLRRDFLAAVRPATGSAAIEVDAPRPAGVRTTPFVRPQRPAPGWVNDQIEVEATVTTRGTSAAAKLRARQKAESDARKDLLNRIESLQLDADTTIGQAAKQDPRLQAAVRRSVERLRPAKVDYRQDGSVHVMFVHKLNALWADVRRY